MKVGLFGGTFDPVHCGHLAPVRQARRLLGLDRVYFLPTADPPHKQDRRMAPAHARYAMVELALLDEPGLFASAHELTPGRPAYTVETLEAVHRSWPANDLTLLIGSDSLLELTSWRRWRDIVALATVAVLPRRGRGAARIEELPSALRDAASAGRIVILDTEPVAVSASEIRRRLGDGEPLPEGWLPTSVLHYLQKYRLYAEPPAPL